MHILTLRGRSEALLKRFQRQSGSAPVFFEFEDEKLAQVKIEVNIFTL
jgi:hypothetical protein